jgi:DNA-binding HxlR family transcriptional regulator
LILRKIFLGSNRFEDLLSATSASRGILTNRLKALVQEGILYRHPYSARPLRHEYRLTRVGEDLYPTALMYWIWEKRYGRDHSLPSELIHRSCGQPAQPVLICLHCRKPIEITDIDVEVLEGYERVPQDPPKRSSLHVSNRIRQDGDSTEVHVLDVIGDRWTALVQASMYFGLHRYADIQTALSIATNTLADRLRLLVNTGVFSRRPYQDNPPRYSYRLTEKGRALYLPAFTLHQWADRWLLRGWHPPLALRHRSCGQLAQGEIICDQCDEPLRLHEVKPVWTEEPESSAHQP